MLYIKKGKEPESLTQYKKEKYAYYDGCNKVDIRNALLRDQGSLCAYCMRRIEIDTMKIEHWLPQSRLDEQKRLDFSIMLGVCNGNQGNPSSMTTCDTHRGNADLTVNPLDKTSMDSIYYSSHDGKIFSTDEKTQMDLHNTLNLNYNGAGAYLCMNRRNVLEECKRKLKRYRKGKTGTWPGTFLQKMLDYYEQFDSQHKKKAYSGIAIWYLKKKLKQCK